MVNLAVLDTLATDWTGQTWSARLRACAETLYIHGCIDFDTYNQALDHLDDAAPLAKSSPSLPRGGGPLPQAVVEGHSSARIVHKPIHGGYPEANGRADPLCHLRRNLANPHVLEGDKGLSRDLLAKQEGGR